jgi:hypothetical protein
MLLAERARVILAGLPRLLEEIVAAAVAAEDDLVLTGSVGDARGLSNTAVDADVLITGENDPAAVLALLDRQPRLKVLAVAHDGESSWLYELRPVLVPMGHLSPASLVAAVRALTEPISVGCES